MHDSSLRPRGWADLIRSAPRRARILVVDDQSAVRRTMTKLLGALGYSTQTVGSAEEGDQWLQNREFDLLLLDVELPRMNGVEFLSWALARHPTLPVIMMTGLDDVGLAMECLDAGARNYLVKPVDPPVLERVVRDALVVSSLLQDRNRLCTGEQPVSLVP